MNQFTRIPSANVGRALIYCRVSTDDQQDHGTSLESQQAACERYAIYHGYTIRPEHVFSGWESARGWRDRRLLGRALDVVRSGEVDVVICYAVDRLSRRQAHTAILADIIAEENRCRLEFVSEVFEDSAVGEFIRNAKAFAAEIELEKIRERTVRGKLTRAKSGKIHNHGPEMYGYRRDKAVSKRVIHETEADVVRCIFRWIAEDGMSVRGVIRRLNDEGVPAATAARAATTDAAPRWGSGAVHRILREPSYKGEAFAWRWESRGAHKQPRLRPQEEWLRLPDGTTPAIVSPEMWQAVQDRLSANKGDTTRNVTRPYLLRGMMTCQVCGKAMHSSPERDRRVYRCSSRDTRHGACGGKRVPAEPVEAWVWGEVSELLQHPARIQAHIDRLRQSGGTATMEADRDAIQRRVAKIERQQESLMRQLRESGGEGRLWELGQAEIAASEKERQQQLAAIEQISKQIAEQQAAVVHLDSLAAYCTTVSSNVDRLSFDDRRTTLEAFDVRVIANGINRQEWRLDWSPPDGIGVGATSRTCSCRVRRGPARPCSPAPSHQCCRQ